MSNVRYTHRYYAEFAKEAMQDQSLGGTDVINIKWCLDETAKSAKSKEEEQREIFLNAVLKNKKLEEQREAKARAVVEAEKKRMEKIKKAQTKHYEEQIEGSNLYNPAFYREFKPEAKLSSEEEQVLHTERSKITEGCAKMNEILQRISYNYQDQQ